MDVILGVAIGVVLTIGVVAVVVSSLMELISAAARMRARVLEQGIARLLDNQIKGPAPGVKGKLGIRQPLDGAPATTVVMGHPLIRALSAARATDRPPSYIDAVTFAMALLGSSIGSVSLINKFLADSGEIGDRVKELPAGEPGDAVKRAWSKAGNDPAKLISALLADDDQGRAGLAALIGTDPGARARISERIIGLSEAGDPSAATLEDAWQLAGQDVVSFVAELEEPDLLSRAVTGASEVTEGIADIKRVNPFLGKALEDLWARAGSDFSRFRGEIEDWFDREMARVSGWYSRWSQWIMVAVALVIAGFLNISVVTVALALWTDPDLRAATVVVAEKQVATSAVPATTVGGATLTVTAPATTGSDATATATAPATTVSDATPAASGPAGVDTLAGVGLPIGWGADAWPGWSGYLVFHLFGVVVTGIAASFGAPFWFDLLNRLVNLRAGGRPPPTAAAERTKQSTA